MRYYIDTHTHIHLRNLINTRSILISLPKLLVITSWGTLAPGNLVTYFRYSAIGNPDFSGGGLWQAARIRLNRRLPVCG